MPGSYQHGVIHPLQSAAGASAKDAMAFTHNVKRTHVELYRHVAIDKAVHAVHEIAFDEPCVIGVKIRQMSACSSDLREPTRRCGCCRKLLSGSSSAASGSSSATGSSRGAAASTGWATDSTCGHFCRRCRASRGCRTGWQLPRDLDVALDVVAAQRGRALRLYDRRVMNDACKARLSEAKTAGCTKTHDMRSCKLQLVKSPIPPPPPPPPFPSLVNDLHGVC